MLLSNETTILHLFVDSFIQASTRAVWVRADKIDNVCKHTKTHAK